MQKVLCPYCQSRFFSEPDGNGVVKCPQCGQFAQFPVETAVANTADSGMGAVPPMMAANEESAQIPAETGAANTADSGMGAAPPMMAPHREIPVENRQPWEKDETISDEECTTSENNINWVFLGINLVVMIFSVVMIIYMSFGYSKIVAGIRDKENQKKIADTRDFCHASMKDLGNVLLSYAKDNDGALPNENNWMSQCRKYTSKNLDYLLKGCSGTIEEYKLHLNHPALPDAGNLKEIVLITCPLHKVAFFADGTVREYSTEEK